MKGLLGGVIQHRLDVGELTALQAGMLGEHRRLGGLEHAVEAAQHGERQDHAAVLGGLVRAAQQVGDALDEADLVAETVHERCPFRRALLQDSPNDRDQRHSIGARARNVRAPCGASGDGRSTIRWIAGGEGGIRTPEPG